MHHKCRNEAFFQLMIIRTDHGVKARPGTECVTAVWLLGEMRQVVVLFSWRSSTVDSDDDVG